MPRKSSSSVKIRYPRYDKERLVRELKKKFSEIAEKYKIKRVVLFGSYAKDKYTASSDIDILIIHGIKNIDLYKKIKKLINIRGLELHIYSIDDYTKSRDRIERMIRKGIEIYP
jgi:predicted nucleotidyltransferase